MCDRSMVLATRNHGKISEFKKLIKGFDIEIKSLEDFGPIPTIEEDGKTFGDNAYKKAYFTAKVLGIPALSDDSGLVVEALGSAPGIYSARYAGENATDEDNNLKLLEDMKGKSNRKAFFESVISIAVPWGPALTYIGQCHGEILHEPRGQNGFGYDPLFYYLPLGKTFAEMSPDEKNGVSHRGKAMREVRREFDKIIIWLDQRMAEGSA